MSRRTRTGRRRRKRRTRVGTRQTIENGTLDFAILVLGDGFSDPIENAQDSYLCLRGGAFKARLLNQTSFANFMFDLGGWLTRRYMLELLTESHPDHDGRGDSLVCFVPELDEVDGPYRAIPPGSFCVVDEKTKGNTSAVTVQQKKKDGSIAGSATLHFVKQDVWRLDKVSRPKT